MFYFCLFRNSEMILKLDTFVIARNYLFLKNMTMALWKPSKEKSAQLRTLAEQGGITGRTVRPNKLNRGAPSSISCPTPLNSVGFSTLLVSAYLMALYCQIRNDITVLYHHIRNYMMFPSMMGYNIAYHTIA